MLYYFIPYTRLQELLTGAGQELVREIRALVDGETLVELRCPLCEGFYIGRYLPGSLDKPCPSCRLKLAHDGHDPTASDRYGSGSPSEVMEGVYAGEDRADAEKIKLVRAKMSGRGL